MECHVRYSRLLHCALCSAFDSIPIGSPWIVNSPSEAFPSRWLCYTTYSSKLTTVKPCLFVHSSITKSGGSGTPSSPQWEHAH